MSIHNGRQAVHLLSLTCVRDEVRCWPSLDRYILGVAALTCQAVAWRHAALAVNITSKNNNYKVRANIQANVQILCTCAKEDAIPMEIHLHTVARKYLYNMQMSIHNK